MTMSETKLKPGIVFSNDFGVWKVVDERDSDTGSLPEREVKVRAISAETAEKGDTEWLTEDEAAGTNLEIQGGFGYSKTDIDSATVLSVVPYSDGPEYREYSVDSEGLPGLLSSIRDDEVSEMVVNVDVERDN